MKRFCGSKPLDEDGKPIAGYRKRMFRERNEMGILESIEQRVCDQAKGIRKNDWLSELKLGPIKRQVEDESQVELCREQVVTVKTETIKTDLGTVEEEMNDAEDSINDTEGDLSEEHRGDC